MDFLAFIAAGLCGWRAYALFRVGPTDTRSWAITAAWAVGAFGALIAGF